MPYNIWCGGCGNHIGMGNNFTAMITVSLFAFDYLIDQLFLKDFIYW